MMEYHINEIIRIQTNYKKNFNKAHTDETVLGRTEFLIVNKIFQKVVLKTKQHRKRRERLLNLPTWRRIDSKKLSRKKGMDKIMEAFELKYRLKKFRISKI